MMIREYNLCDFSSLKLVNICFFTQNIVYLGERSWILGKKCKFSCWWASCSTNISEIQLDDGVVQLFHIRADFWSAHPICYYKSYLKSPATVLDLSVFPFSCISFSLCILNFCC